MNPSMLARVMGCTAVAVGIVLLGVSMVHPTETPPRTYTAVDWALVVSGLLLAGIGLRVASPRLYAWGLSRRYARLLVLPLMIAAVGVAVLIVKFVLHQP